MAGFAYVNVTWDGPAQYVRADCVEAIFEDPDNVGVDLVLTSGRVVECPGRLASEIIDRLGKALALGDGA